jgi:hypothetical protein
MVDAQVPLLGNQGKSGNQGTHGKFRRDLVTKPSNGK